MNILRDTGQAEDETQLQQSQAGLGQEPCVSITSAPCSQAMSAPARWWSHMAGPGAVSTIHTIYTIYTIYGSQDMCL